jgi:hypothetical protein
MELRLSRLYLYNEHVDFRKSINGLSELFSREVGGKLELGMGCLFYNVHNNKLKLLHVDSYGLCLWQKRFEERRFKIGSHFSRFSLIGEDELLWLRSGLDLGVFDYDLCRKLVHFY